MLDMRLRYPELMRARGMTTAYALAKASKGEIPLSTANRLVEADGRPKRIDLSTIDALCELFGLKPWQMFSGDDPDDVAPDVPKPKARRR